MKRNAIIAASVLLLLIIGAVFLLRAPKPEHLVVVSDDGAATLEFPTDSLPSDVDIAEISVIAEPIPDGIADGDLILYSLNPSGLTLNAPAVLRIEMPLEGDEVRAPFIEHIGENGELKDLDDMSLEVDMTTRIMTAKASLDSFSWITVSRSGPILYAATVNPNQDSFKVGENFTVQTLVATDPDRLPRTEREISIYTTEDGGTLYDFIIVDDMITVSDGQLFAPSYIGPALVDDVPDKEGLFLFTDDNVLHDTEFTCLKVGPSYGRPSTLGYGFTATMYLQLVRKRTGIQAGETQDVELTEAESRPRVRKNGYAVTVRVACTASEEASGTTGATTSETPSPTIEMTYAHVKPGQYSEVYMSVVTEPGTNVIATLAGPAVDAPARQEIVADEKGVAHFTWKIFAYGSYHAMIHVGEETEFPWRRTIEVQ